MQFFQLCDPWVFRDLVELRCVAGQLRNGGESWTLDNVLEIDDGLVVSHVAEVTASEETLVPWICPNGHAPLPVRTSLEADIQSSVSADQPEVVFGHSGSIELFLADSPLADARQAGLSVGPAVQVRRTLGSSPAMPRYWFFPRSPERAIVRTLPGADGFGECRICGNRRVVCSECLWMKGHCGACGSALAELGFAVPVGTSDIVVTNGEAFDVVFFASAASPKSESCCVSERFLDLLEHHLCIPFGAISIEPMREEEYRDRLRDCGAIDEGSGR